MSGGVRRWRGSVRVPSERRGEGEGCCYRAMKEGEAITVARGRSSVCSDSPGIARRNWRWRRTEAVADGYVDLVHQKKTGPYQNERTEQGEVKGEGGRARGRRCWPERGELPAAGGGNAGSKVRSLAA